MSLLPVRPVSQGNKEGHRKGRTGRGAKGTFQGEQRPTETDPPTTAAVSPSATVPAAWQDRAGSPAT